MEQQHNSRVEEVMQGIEAYGEMGAIVNQLAGGHPLVAMVMANWLSIWLNKLVDWEVLSEEERTTVMMRVASITAERRAAIKARADKGDDGPGGLLYQMGI